MRGAMVRFVPVALSLAVFSCSSRSGSPDASVAIPVPPPQPAAVLPPATGAPPSQFRRPVLDKAVVEGAVQAFERSKGNTPPAPAQPQP